MHAPHAGSLATTMPATTTTALDFLLVSNNYETLTAVKNGLKEFGAHLGFVPTIDYARDYLARRKIDGIFVDMEVPGAAELVQSIRVEIFQRLSHTLFEICGCDNLQVFTWWQALLMQFASRRLHHQLKVVEGTIVSASNRNLAFPIRPEIREHCVHGLIPQPVTAKCRECRRDVLDAELNAKLFSNHLAAPQAVGG